MNNVFTVNAFTKDGKGGNPAGVVPSAEHLSSSEMQSIAKKLNYSETAFVVSQENNTFRVRYFAPTEEVNLCGHATVATFHLLKETGVISNGEFTLISKAGNLGIWINGADITMQQASPVFSDIFNAKDICSLLNIDPKEISSELSSQIVSTGLRDLLVPINDLDTLLRLNPNFSNIKEFSKKHDLVGLHAFSLETMDKGSTAHCRNFAPLFEIDEECATGTSNGALASYLYKHNVLTSGQTGNLVFEQGYSMDKPSEIKAELITTDNEIKMVKVGGSATTIADRL